MNKQLMRKTDYNQHTHTEEEKRDSDEKDDIDKRIKI
jgi:hypothetical protein